ncbi:MAG TPA: CHAT domain-containing protein [Pyrinomonadaceae bacterium]|jgi:CHAT domain-containing protein|nr:CHAT domain-containing protein [Pyrinomonadaceae bacterium]
MKIKDCLIPLITLAVFLTSIPQTSREGIARARNRAAAVPVIKPDYQKEQSPASLSLKQGRLLLRRGQASEAISLLQTALKLFKEANNSKGEAATNDALGDLYLRQGQYSIALSYYTSAHEAFKAAIQKQGAAESIFGVPDNDYNAALMLAKVGDTNFRMGKTAEATLAYMQMNVTKPGQTPIPTQAAAPKKPSWKDSLIGGAKVMVGKLPGGAILQTVQATVGIYRQCILYSTHELGMGRLDYFNNNLDGSKQHFEAALAVASLPISSFGQSRRVRAVARTSLGDIALRQSRYDDAVKLYTDASKGATKDKRLDLIWPAQRGLGLGRWMQASQEGDAQKAAKSREAAVASYRDALRTIETIRQGSLRADEARSTFLTTTKDVYDEASGILAEMALMGAPADGSPLAGQSLVYAAEAFNIAEQGRARSLLEMLGEAGANFTEGMPPELLKRKQENLDRQQEIAQILTGVAEPEGEKPDVKKLEAELETLATDYDSIENQIRAASPRYSALTAPQPLTLAEVQQQVLDDKTALLEYNLGNERSYLWVATQSGVSLYRLPARAAVNQQVQDLRAQLIPPRLQRRIAGIDVAAAEQQRGLGISSTPLAGGATGGASAFAGASNALYKTVVEPAASAIGDKRLLVVADGALNYVPFEALVATSGGSDYASLPYLVKSREIVYAPSASVVAVVRQMSKRSTEKGILIVADPVFNASDPRAKSSATPTTTTTTAAATPAAATAAVAAPQNGSFDANSTGLASALADVVGDQPVPPGKGLELARLSGTRTEATRIAQMTRTSGSTPEVWLDLEANEAGMMTHDLKKYRIIHIATHGLLNAERPQFTGLVFSLVGNKSSDGFLRSDEVFNLNLNGALIILSACETGLGKEKRGEGIIGLTRAFMYAGAPTVGVSLWSVADQSTADLMTNFYKRLLASPGVSPSAAMRVAQTDMIAGKRYSAPFYWAPFVLVGDWH